MAQVRENRTDRVPGSGVRGGRPAAIRRVEPAPSSALVGQLDENIMARRIALFQCHVSRPLNGPFVVLLQQDGTDETGDGVLVGKDPDDVGSPLDLSDGAFDGIGGVQFGAVRCSLGKFM